MPLQGFDHDAADDPPGRCPGLMMLHAFGVAAKFVAAKLVAAKLVFAELVVAEIEEEAVIT